MGLDAIVMCNCWRDGRVRPPPVPRELIGVEEGYLVLTLPYEGNEELTHTFDDWEQADDLCEHGRLKAAVEWISNWGGVATLRRAFASVGPAHLPTLVELLPAVNGGEVTPAEAQRALDEIPVFRERFRLKTWEIFEEASSRTVIADLPPDGRQVITGRMDPFDLWAGPSGLYFLPTGELISGSLDETAVSMECYSYGGPTDASDAPHGAVFRSAHFEQEPAGEAVVYRDVDSGATFRSRHALRVSREDVDGAERPLAGRCAVRERMATAADFTHMLGRLETVLRASVETGNSVYWT